MHRIVVWRLGVWKYGTRLISFPPGSLFWDAGGERPRGFFEYVRVLAWLDLTFFWELG
jgi:hypothetical protein